MKEACKALEKRQVNKPPGIFLQDLNEGKVLILNMDLAS